MNVVDFFVELGNLCLANLPLEYTEVIMCCIPSSMRDIVEVIILSDHTDVVAVDALAASLAEGEAAIVVTVVTEVVIKPLSSKVIDLKSHRYLKVSGVHIEVDILRNNDVNVGVVADGADNLSFHNCLLFVD